MPKIVRGHQAEQNSFYGGVGYMQVSLIAV